VGETRTNISPPTPSRQTLCGNVKVYAMILCEHELVTSHSRSREREMVETTKSTMLLQMRKSEQKKKKEFTQSIERVQLLPPRRPPIRGYPYRPVTRRR